MTWLYHYLLGTTDGLIIIGAFVLLLVVATRSLRTS
jgi:hypothetical protein